MKICNETISWKNYCQEYCGHTVVWSNVQDLNQHPSIYQTSVPTIKLCPHIADGVDWNHRCVDTVGQKVLMNLNILSFHGLQHWHRIELLFSQRTKSYKWNKRKQTKKFFTLYKERKKKFNSIIFQSSIKIKSGMI
jgi:hypothetical protein